MRLRTIIAAVVSLVTLAFGKAHANITIPANGRIVLETNRPDEQCEFWLKRGDNVLPLDKVETHRFLGRGRIVLSPRKHLPRGTYRLSYRCANGTQVSIGDTQRLGLKKVSTLVSTGVVDLTPPVWVEPAKVLSRSYGDASCSGVVETSVLFSTIVADDSAIWMRAHVWDADGQSWSFLFPVENDETSVKDLQYALIFPLVNSMPWHGSLPVNIARRHVGAQFSAGARNLVLFCAVDAANNETCAPGPLVPFIGPTQCDNETHKRYAPRSWCNATPTPTLEPIILTTTTSLVPSYRPSTFARQLAGGIGLSAFAWLLLYWRSSRRHRVEQILGRLGDP